MVSTFIRAWINRLWLPSLLVVSWTGKTNSSLSPFAPENLASRDGFGRPVPRHPAFFYTLAESGAYSQNSSRFPRRRLYIYRQPTSGQSRNYRITQLRTDGVHCRQSTGTEPVALKAVGVTGSCLFGYHHAPLFFMRLSFLTPIIVHLSDTCTNISNRTTPKIQKNPTVLVLTRESR